MNASQVICASEGSGSVERSPLLRWCLRCAAVTNRVSRWRELARALDSTPVPCVSRSSLRVCVPRQVVGRISLVLNVGVVGSARPRCTSLGRFHEMASWGRSSLYSIR